MTDDMVDIARSTIAHGNKYPYDAPDAWWNGGGLEPPAPLDWAHSAARGILADLNDRKGIKQGFAGIDEDTRAEIVKSLASIVRAARLTDTEGNG